MEFTNLWMEGEDRDKYTEESLACTFLQPKTQSKDG